MSATKADIQVLADVFGINSVVPNKLRAADLPPLRRCLAAGYCEVVRSVLVLTPRGRAAVDRARAEARSAVRANPARTRPRTPAIVRHCVARVAEKRAGSRGRGAPSRADLSAGFAICTASLQRAGVLSGAALTAKGRKANAKHGRRTSKNRAKDAAFERALRPTRLRAEVDAERAARAKGIDAVAQVEDHGRGPILGVKAREPLSSKGALALENAVRVLGWRAWAIDHKGIAFKPTWVDLERRRGAR
jgi:hypothetical protein